MGESQAGPGVHPPISLVLQVVNFLSCYGVLMSSFVFSLLSFVNTLKDHILGHDEVVEHPQRTWVLYLTFYF